MNRPLRLDLLAGILGVATGLGIAAAWSSSRRSETSSSHGNSAPISAAAEPRLDARAVETTAPTPPDRLAAPLPSARDERPFWQTLAAVSVPDDKADRWLKLPPLRVSEFSKSESQLNPEFAEFFGLNEAEQAQIVAELDAVIAQQAELDLKAARPIPILESDGFLAQYEIALRVGLYPEAGAALHDRLHASLAATLGPERMAVYESWAATSLLADWRGLGLSERTIHIKRQNPDTPY